jgi:hypothetical protein
MGVFVNKHGIVKFLTGRKISKVLQSVAKACHPDLTRDEIMRFSSHSGRVWAIVILDEAGMLPDFNFFWFLSRILRGRRGLSPQERKRNLYHTDVSKISDSTTLRH